MSSFRMQRKVVFMHALGALVLLTACHTSDTAADSGGTPHDAGDDSRWTLPDIFSDGVLIAHAAGTIDDIVYSNSLEAFEDSIVRGSRVIEIDLSFTLDGDLVCFHDGFEEYIELLQNIEQLTTVEFIEKRYRHQLTSMTFKDVLRIMQREPELHVVLDIKPDFPDGFAAVVRETNEVDPALMPRLIPELRNRRDYPYLRNMPVDAVPAFIWAIYNHAYLSDREIVSFVEENRIPVVAVPDWGERYSPELVADLARVGAKVILHTINDVEEMKRYRSEGVTGFYTDFVKGPTLDEASW